MKARYRIFNLIVALMLIVILVGNVFAWFTSTSFEIKVTGKSEGAYFKGGSGSQNDPFTLGNFRHFYNLAWLQNTGKLNKDEKEYYFALDPDDGDTLDMLDDEGKPVVVPPIGTTDNPFIGHFDGRGKKISNLYISTNKDVLYGEHSKDSFNFSNSVGMFGMTGESSEIKNFILDNPTVEVASEAQNTAYSQVDTTTDPAAVGLAIGYVNGKASSIGVLGGRYVVRRESSNYKTFNSIIGDMSAAAKENNSITGDNSSSPSNSETGIFYPDFLHNTIENNSSKYSSIIDATTSAHIQLATNIWINSSGTNDELGLGGISFTTNYGTSSQTRLRYANNNSSSPVTTFKYIKSQGTHADGSDIVYETTDETKLIDVNIAKDSNNSKEGDEIKQKIIDNKKTQINQLQYEFYIQGSIQTNNKPYNITVYNPDGTIRQYKNGEQTADLTGSMNVYSRSIKVNIVSNKGKVFFIARSNGTQARTIGIYKAASATQNYSYSEPEKFLTTSAEKYDEQLSDPYQELKLPADGAIYACEFDLSSVYDTTGKLIAGGPGAYLIGAASSGAINILYMSISGMDEGTVADTGELGEGLSAIDFIYDDVAITQTGETYTDGTADLAAYNFIDTKNSNKLYIASQVRVYYNSITSTLYIGFSRTKSGDSINFTVTHNGQEPLLSGSGKANLNSEYFL